MLIDRVGLSSPDCEHKCGGAGQPEGLVRSLLKLQPELVSRSVEHNASLRLTKPATGCGGDESDRLGTLGSNC